MILLATILILLLSFGLLSAARVEVVPKSSFPKTWCWSLYLVKLGVYWKYYDTQTWETRLVASFLGI